MKKKKKNVKEQNGTEPISAQMARLFLTIDRQFDGS
jgi:hypothetical protein